MEFMLIFFRDENAEDHAEMGEMGRFAGELSQAGKMRGGAPLKSSSEGARVRIRDGKMLLTDGPFSETKESVGGFFIIDCEDRAEAIEFAKRCPHAKVGNVEVREVIAVGPRT